MWVGAHGIVKGILSAGYALGGKRIHVVDVILNFLQYLGALLRCQHAFNFQVECDALFINVVESRVQFRRAVFFPVAEPCAQRTAELGLLWTRSEHCKKFLLPPLAILVAQMIGGGYRVIEHGDALFLCLRE